MSLKYRSIPVTLFRQNCSVIWCDKTQQAAVVDPGGDAERIQHLIEKLGVKVEKILLTHGHLDHVGAGKILAEHYQVPIYGPHADDAFLLDSLDQQSQRFGFDAVANYQPDAWLKDGDSVNVGESTLEVLHTPGHTPGHVVFFSEPDQLAWVGDVIFKESIGRTDFPRGNHAQLIQSINQKLMPKGDEVTFIPGHGFNSTLGHEKRYNPFL